MDIFLDVETSGLNNYKHGVWQIAGILFNEDGTEEEAFNIIMEIFDHQEWDETAHEMAVNNGYLDMEKVKPSSAFIQLKDILETYVNPFDRQEKLTMYAYNASFDEKFMRSFFYNNRNNFFGSYFWKPVIDVMSLAGEHLKDQRDRLPDFKQATVAKYIGLEVDESKLHDAMYDIRLMKRIYNKINN